MRVRCQFLYRSRHGVQAWGVRHPTTQRVTADREAEPLDMVCSDVEVEPGLQPVTGETLNRGANQEIGTRLDIHAAPNIKESGPLPFPKSSRMNI